MTDAERRALKAIADRGAGNLSDGGMERKLIRKGWLNRQVFTRAVFVTEAGAQALAEQEHDD